MNRLQKFIGDKLAAGRGFRDMERESGVDHSNLSRYYNRGQEPDAKNLVKLAEYFGVEFHELLEPYAPKNQPPKDKIRELIDEMIDRAYGQRRTDEDKLELAKAIAKIAGGSRED